MLREGDAAPDFTTRDENGKEVRLSDFRGQKVALYFYPKDDTPGCTKEACSFRDNYSAIEESGVKVLGVSLDDEASHQAFILYLRWLPVCFSGATFKDEVSDGA